METGERNFYEVKHDISKYLVNLEKLQVSKAISKNIFNRLLRCRVFIFKIKTSGNVFKRILEENREMILNLIDVWKMSNDKEIKIRMVNLIGDIFYVDNQLIDVVFNHTALVQEICYLIQDFIKLKEIAHVSVLLNFLTIVFTNCKPLSSTFKG